MVKKKKQVKTTGHIFDGIEEYNNRLPRWWKIVFVVCIFIALTYALFYPSIPTHKGFFKGLSGWTSHNVLNKDLEKVKETRKVYYEKIKTSSFEEIKKDPQLKEFAIKGATYFFQDNCAPCHAKGGGGQKGGFPVLVDDDWLWGGKIEEIYKTINYGIRNSNPDSRQNAMLRFEGILTKGQISDVADFVLSLSDKNYKASGITRGAEVFAKNCASCHGKDGKGNQYLGAPNLTDKIWLYGGTKENIVTQVNNPKLGMMPAWGERLDPEIIKMLTIYVHELGGGQQ
ncbi:MAG: cytochrome-c oxidase, cbb3-type subunit III [Alphaproteobacteria bacterium]|jgi:cytochrome c oxidase cbb3-type subunit 3